MIEDKDGYIYVIKHGDTNIYKIGMSRDPEIRIKE
jgi:predicted GIY-YIG superfamily endonuclease